jgi:hypothetical protein
MEDKCIYTFDGYIYWAGCPKGTGIAPLRKDECCSWCGKKIEVKELKEEV